MIITQQSQAEHLAAIAQHLNHTAEATASDQRAGAQYISETGDYIRRMFHSDHGGGITFGYYILAYDHVPDISVEVQHSGIETRIMVSHDIPADVIAHTAMSALHTAIDIITTAQQGAAA